MNAEFLMKLRAALEATPDDQYNQNEFGLNKTNDCGCLVRVAVQSGLISNSWNQYFRTVTGMKLVAISSAHVDKIMHDADLTQDQVDYLTGKSGQIQKIALEKGWPGFAWENINKKDAMARMDFIINFGN